MNKLAVLKLMLYQQFIHHHAEMGLNAPFRLFASLDITSFISQPLTALFVLSTNFLALVLV